MVFLFLSSHYIACIEEYSMIKKDRAKPILFLIHYYSHSMVAGGLEVMS